MNFRDLLPKIIGFIALVITIALAPSIYTANLSVVNYGGGSGLTNFIGMGAIAPFGGFLIIFGILIAQGIFNIAGYGGAKASGWKDILVSVGAVIVVIILLNVYVSAVLPGFTGLIASASVASDTIGQTVFGVVPIVIYLAIIIGAIGSQGSNVIAKKVGNWRKGKGKGASQAAVSYQ
jgi:hypothetical protein